MLSQGISLPESRDKRYHPWWKMVFTFVIVFAFCILSGISIPINSYNFLYWVIFAFAYWVNACSVYPTLYSLWISSEKDSIKYLLIISGDSPFISIVETTQFRPRCGSFTTEMQIFLMSFVILHNLKNNIIDKIPTAHTISIITKKSSISYSFKV